MHPIQRHILKVLTVIGEMRYRDLKPKEIDGNQFMYHLGVVIKKGYVKKVGILYLLTTDGKMYADRAEFDTFIPRIQPKIVTMICCVNRKNETLLFKRTRSPVSNLVHLPYGKIHMGEPVKEAANRELKEKSGLEASLTHIGDIYVRVYDGDELIANILHHVFIGKNPTGEILEKTVAGIPFWSKIEDVPKKELIGGFKEIIEIIEKNKSKFFFEEFDLHLPKLNPQT